MRITAFATAVALSIPGPGQTAPCESLNAATSNTRAISSFTGLQTSAWEIQAQQTGTVQAIRIITEYLDRTKPYGYMTLSIHLPDPATGFPAAEPIARGTWYIASRAGLAWQGTNLDRPVSLTGGNLYWIVWQEPGGSTPPFDPDPTRTAPRVQQLVYRNGGWSLFGKQPVKYQLYCNLLDDTNVTTQGAACTNSLGIGGTLFTNQAPAVGNANFALEATGFPPGAPAILLLGFIQNWPVLPLPGFPAGCTLSSEPFTSFSSATGVGSVVAGTAAGHARFPLGLPNNANLVGLFMSSQAGVFDVGASAPVKVVTSNAVQSTLF